MQILPPNATTLEKALEMLIGARVGAIGAPLRDIWSPWDCPEDLLPWLAWALSIDSWDATWPLRIRRARIAAAIAVQRRKGTTRSIQDVVASFGGHVVMREWFEQDPPGEPHTFTLTVSISGNDGAAPTSEFVDQVIAEVVRTKPVRSHFTFLIATDALGAIGVVAAARPVVFARLMLGADAAPESALLLSGDQQDGGADALQLNGDQQDGDDRLQLSIFS
ncbi:phage tail protein I [Croceicoccus sp. BE223]|uniref:phage tail protein I n=1 Tax=Croceicoccus sp. BE223 TaxID=2817716 RepID=UPI002858F546|nr:phage tail protein I [Croceicoccus sp. BE223]MDR7101459.1 phage tail P2-like protein [Croceicoccus sp. BE223]